MKNTRTTPSFWRKYRAWMIGGGILLLAGIGLVLHARGKDGEQGFSAPTSRKPSSSGGFCTSRDYPLDYGTCHSDVALLQRGLKLLGANLGGYGPGKEGVDGKFGKMTREAALRFLGKASFSRADVDRARQLLQGRRLT